jgi:parvulin-like peptidyl-prolyl isomerase
MTFRARQSPSRSRPWDDRGRRNFLMNLGFGLTIVLALLLLAIAGGVAWYGGHLAAAAKVNDQTINKDQLAKQVTVDSFIVDYQRRHVRNQLSSGHLWATDANARISALDTQLTSIQSSALNQLTQGLIQENLVTKQGLTLTDADVQAKITQASTTPEMRHVWMILVAPTLATGETSATDAEKAAAKAKADQALSALKGGGDWATIAKSTSTDTASAPGGGDVGYVDSNSGLDTAFVTALFAAPLNTPTAVVTGADGSYRIGRVTDILAPVVDATFVDQAKAAGISTDDLNQTFRYAAANTKLSDAITAAAMASAPQRHVYEIYMQANAAETGTSAIRVRYILYSPNHDPNAAKTLAATDPAWAKAKALADAAYAKLQADPSQFDAIARSETDDTTARTSGGKLPYQSTDNSGLDPSFAAAIFKAGLQPGQLLAPFNSSFGWFVVQVMHGPTDAAWAAKLVTKATDLATFQTLARDNSDDKSSGSQGDIGWIGQHTYQVSDTLAAAIFAAPVGKVSTVTTVAGDGIYIYWVAAETTKAPDGDQATAIKASAYSTWYSTASAAYTVWQDPAITGSTTG